MNLFSHRLTWITTLALLASPGVAPAAPQEMSAEDVVARSIAFHDPHGMWAAGSFRFDLMQTQHIRGYTKVDLIIDNGIGKFWMQRDRLGQVTETTITGDACWTLFNGSSEYSEEDAQRFQLSCDEMKDTRDYYTYLYGLPMKLRDPGTIIDSAAARAQFDGEEVWQVRVTYDPDVGTDVWYFYFSPEDFSLTGYRFYHDEEANDGEYILLDRLEEGDLRVPKVRAWFRNSDDQLVGTDKIMGMERISRDR
jgi:hypothetical protein